MDVLLTVKHVIADFVLQTSWMAIGKDQKTGWALPLLAHCLVHLAVAMALILIIAPRFWFVALIDFAIHITIDRAKGLCASTFGVTLERASMVLDADRRRSGAASSHRIWPVDFHGGERLIPVSGFRVPEKHAEIDVVRHLVRSGSSPVLRKTPTARGRAHR